MPPALLYHLAVITIRLTQSLAVGLAQSRQSNGINWDVYTGHHRNEKRFIDSSIECRDIYSVGFGVVGRCSPKVEVCAATDG